MTGSILIVEDDKYQAEEIERCLKPMGVHVYHVSTELQFRKHLKETRQLTYGLAIVDMMLRWTDPAPDMEDPPQEIIQEGFYTAGLRCCRELAKRKVRCLIFTALDPARIPLGPGENFEILNKSAGYSVLADRVKQLLFP
jgi:ActR/RegA family two-component response regulator